MPCPAAASFRLACPPPGISEVAAGVGELLFQQRDRTNGRGLGLGRRVRGPVSLGHRVLGLGNGDLTALPFGPRRAAARSSHAWLRLGSPRRGGRDRGSRRSPRRGWPLGGRGGRRLPRRRGPRPGRAAGRASPRRRGPPGGRHHRQRRARRAEAIPAGGPVQHSRPQLLGDLRIDHGGAQRGGDLVAQRGHGDCMPHAENAWRARVPSSSAAAPTAP
jgi:hypothetical protein